MTLKPRRRIVLPSQREGLCQVKDTSFYIETTTEKGFRGAKRHQKQRTSCDGHAGTKITFQHGAGLDQTQLIDFLRLVDAQVLRDHKNTNTKIGRRLLRRRKKLSDLGIESISDSRNCHTEKMY